MAGKHLVNMMKYGFVRVVIKSLQKKANVKIIVNIVIQNIKNKLMKAMIATLTMKIVVFVVVESDIILLIVMLQNISKVII